MENRSSSSPNSPQPAPSKRRRNSSVVWDHFVKSKPDADQVIRARCKWCSQVYVWSTKGKSSGTTNMKKHLLECPEIVDVNGEESRPTFDQEVFREMLARAVVKHNLPLSFVEYEEVRELFSYLNPKVVNISRNTVKSDVMKLFEKEKSSIKEELKLVRSNICLTTDLWTSISTDGYLALTAHFVDEEWRLQKRVLNFRHVLPPHTGSDLGVSILNLLREWGIEKKIFTVTLDNASYNDGLVDMLRRNFQLGGSAICDGDFLHVRCGAHVLNLIVQAGLKVIGNSVSKIRECVKFVRAGEARKVNFARCIYEVSLPCQKKVIQDMPIRWNSTYRMLDSALYFRLAFEKLKNTDPAFKCCPSEDEWNKVSTISKFLKPFFDITTLFSGSQYPTANLYFHGVWKIESLISNAMLDDDLEIQTMGKDMRVKFNKYWENYSLILSFALILDPRFKMRYVERIFYKLYRPEIAAQRVSNIGRNFKMLFDDYVRRSSFAQISSPTVGMYANNMDSEVDDITLFEIEENATSRNYYSELDDYLKEARSSATGKFDVLGYWKNIRSNNRYPVLSSMAKDILSIPITTVASESTFSIGGRVIGKFRSSLLPDTAEALVCTRDWLFGVEATENSLEEADFVDDFAPLLAQLNISGT